MADAALPSRDRVEGYFKELNNWGRWGHDDQLGTVNLITPAKQAQAQRLIKKGRTVSLARDVVPRPVYMYHMTFPSKRERVDVVLDRFDMVYHGFWITHVDALCHVGWDGELYNGRPFAESLTTEGALWCPIDPIFERGITTRGVFLDIAAGRKEGYVTVGHPVTPKELDEAERRAGVKVEPGDVVVVRSGDEKFRLENPDWKPRISEHPGLHLSCLEWFRAQDIAEDKDLLLRSALRRRFVGLHGPVERRGRDFRRNEPPVLEGGTERAENPGDLGARQLHGIDAQEPTLVMVEVHEIQADAAFPRAGDGNMPTPESQTFHGRLEHGASDCIPHHVDAPAGRRGPHRVRQGSGRRIDEQVGTGSMCILSGCANDSRVVKMCDLRSRLTHGTGNADDEDHFSGAELGGFDQCTPRRDIRDAYRGGLSHGQIAGLFGKGVGRHDHVFGVRPVAEHPEAGSAPPDLEPDKAVSLHHNTCIVTTRYPW